MLIIPEMVIIDKEVEVGDMVYVDNPGRLCHANFGQCLRVVDIESNSGNLIRVYNERKGRIVFLHDGEYSVCSIELIKYVGTEVRKKRILGIPIGKEEVEIWEALE